MKNAYKDDAEGWPAYTELRDMLITAADFNAVTGERDGIIFIDGIGNLNASGNEAAVSNYEEYGPNNELYLAPGQAVAFKLNAGVWNNGKLDSSNIASVQLAVKAVNGNVDYKLYDASKELGDVDAVTVKTATDMYFELYNTDEKDLDKKLNGKTIIIANTTEQSHAILSITNIKVTFKNNPGSADLDLSRMLTVTSEMDEQVILSLRSAVVTVPAPEEGTTGNVTEETKPISSVTKAILKGFSDTINWIKKMLNR